MLVSYKLTWSCCATSCQLTRFFIVDVHVLLVYLMQICINFPKIVVRTLRMINLQVIVQAPTHQWYNQANAYVCLCKQFVHYSKKKSNLNFMVRTITKLVLDSIITHKNVSLTPSIFLPCCNNTLSPLKKLFSH